MAQDTALPKPFAVAQRKALASVGKGTLPSPPEATLGAPKPSVGRHQPPPAPCLARGCAPCPPGIEVKGEKRSGSARMGPVTAWAATAYVRGPIHLFPLHLDRGLRRKQRARHGAGGLCSAEPLRSAPGRRSLQADEPKLWPGSQSPQRRASFLLRTVGGTRGSRLRPPRATAGELPPRWTGPGPVVIPYSFKYGTLPGAPPTLGGRVRHFAQSHRPAWVQDKLLPHFHECGITASRDMLWEDGAGEGPRQVRPRYTTPAAIQFAPTGPVRRRPG